MGMLLDEAIELSKDKNNNVLFVYCGGLNEMCLFNRKGSKPLCHFCSNCTKKVLSQYNVPCRPLTDYYIQSSENHVFGYNSSSSLRKITYRDVNIGLSIMSGYISGFRNLSPAINEGSRKYFDAHLAQNVRYVDAFYNLLAQFSPDVVYSFNGRYEEVRPVFDICMAKKVKLVLSEGFIKDGRWQKLFYINHLPHDIKYLMERRNYCWDHYEMTDEEKIELGNSFYQNRRHGKYAGDKIYVKDQTAGKVPPIDTTKMNIAIMNSSEDEYASVGGDWDDLQFFPSQYEGILFMLENATPNMHFYLRIHPNLKGINYKYHTALLQLGERHKNITVIPAESDISTYSLLDKMDKMVCFGSTMGIESVYWKKPVILLSAGLYYYDDICYLPKDKDEFLKLLGASLEPKYNESVIRYGAWSMNQDPLIIPNNNVDFQGERPILFGRPFSVVPFISFFINKRMTGIYIAIMRALFGASFFNRYETPLVEE